MATLHKKPKWKLGHELYALRSRYEQQVCPGCRGAGEVVLRDGGTMECAECIGTAEVTVSRCRVIRVQIVEIRQSLDWGVTYMSREVGTSGRVTTHANGHGLYTTEAAAASVAAEHDTAAYTPSRYHPPTSPI
jgi:hypothetical protein